MLITGCLCYYFVVVYELLFNLFHCHFLAPKVKRLETINLVSCAANLEWLIALISSKKQACVLASASNCKFTKNLRVQV